MLAIDHILPGLVRDCGEGGTIEKSSLYERIKHEMGHNDLYTSLLGRALSRKGFRVAKRSQNVIETYKVSGP